MPDEPLNADQILVLVAIRDGAHRPAEIRRPPAQRRNEAIAALAARGLVQVAGPARSRALSLPADAVALAATLQAPPPARSAGVAKSPSRVETDLAATLRRLDRLEETLTRLEGKLDRALATAESRAPTPPPLVKQAILDALQALDARHRFGGLVPLPDLRRELGALGGERQSVDAALAELEREFAIDLNIAQAPSQVAERSAGIERPGRGLLYYVTRRSS